MSPGDRRALVLGACVIGTVLAGRLAVTARDAIEGRQQAAARAGASLDAAMREVRQRPVVDSLARQLVGSRLHRQDRVLEEVTEATATDAFIELLEVAAEEAGAVLVAAHPVADSATIAALRRVTLAVELESDLEGVLKFLSCLARDSLAVQVGSLALGTADAKAMRERLRADLVLRAWYGALGGVR